MAPKFELYIDKAGENLLPLQSPNGEIMFGFEIDGRRQHPQVTKHTAIVGPAHRAQPRCKAGDFE
jgi:hypothetical protein